MKTTLVVLALGLLSVPAFAGSHVEGIIGRYTVPAWEGAVKAPKILSAKYGKVVVREWEEGNCDSVANGGDSSGCYSKSEKAYKVRVLVGYESARGADPTPEASAENAESGPVTLTFDFDPSEFSAETLARIQGLKDARELFALTATGSRQLVDAIDYDHSDYCSPEADSSCENHVVYKKVTANLTTLTVTLK